MTLVTENKPPTYPERRVLLRRPDGIWQFYPGDCLFIGPAPARIHTTTEGVVRLYRETLKAIYYEREEAE